MSGTITAGELRACGSHIDPDIPDCAWIPRVAMVFGKPYVSMDKGNKIVSVGLPIKINAPFRWTTDTFTLVEKTESSPYPLQPVVPEKDEL